MADVNNPWATAQEAKQHYEKNKAYAYDSKAKSLLYGGQPPPTPGSHPQGKRGVPHAGGNNTLAPFATYDASVTEAASTQGGQVPKQYNAKPGQKEGSGKVQQTAFDPEVYRQNIQANANNRAAQRQRNWGSGNITGFKDQQQQKEEREQEMRQHQPPY